MPQGFGIVSYGQYIPYYRLELEALKSQWGMPDPMERAYRMLGRSSLSVSALDEDTVTLAIEAGESALVLAPDVEPTPNCVLVGSETHPYAVKPTSVIVAEALGLTPEVFAADLEFACKGGTAALILATSMVKSGTVESAIAIGADCPQTAPGSLLEASVGSGAAAFVVGREKVLAIITAAYSVASDTSDFWRRDGTRYPSVLGKFSSNAGYREHTLQVLKRLLDSTHTEPSDYSYLCLHQPYHSLPLAIAKEAGFNQAQVTPGLISSRIGNTYASNTLLAICSVLDIAQPGDRVAAVSFGSGAGADGFCLEVTEHVLSFRRRQNERQIAGVRDLVRGNHCVRLDYGRFCILQDKLVTR